MTKLWLALQTLSAIFGAIRDFFAWKRSSDDRKAGSDAAIVEGQRQEDAALSEVDKAVDEVTSRHRSDQTDGAFKNTEFRD